MPNQTALHQRFSQALIDLTQARHDADAAAIALIGHAAPHAIALAWTLESEWGDEGTSYTFVTDPVLRLADGTEVAVPRSLDPEHIEEGFDLQFCDPVILDALQEEMPDAPVDQLHLTAYARLLQVGIATVTECFGAIDHLLGARKYEGAVSLHTATENAAALRIPASP